MKERYDDLDEYIADLKKEIEANAQCATHYYNLGLALLSKRDFVAAEEALLSRWVDSLPEPVCTEMRTLYAEMAALQTTEAKIYKALDKMEASVQHNESAIATWEPQEYALNLTYGVEQSQFSPYMQALREAIRQETLRKMEQEGATPQP